MKSFLRSFPPSTDLRRAVVSNWRKYGHLVLVNCLGGLNLPRNSEVRLTDRPDMTIAVDCGRKAPAQQVQHQTVLTKYFIDHFIL